MFEEPLQLCPLEKWSELEDIFKDDWPRSISCVILLQMQRYILQRGLDHGCKVYCPYGNGRYGIVVVNTKKGLNEVIVQCPSDDTNKLEEALKATSIIDWDKEIEIPFVPRHVVASIKRVTENTNIAMHIITATTYILDKSAPLFDVEIPQGFSFDLLSMKYVDLLASTWQHRYDGCEFYFEFIIKANLGYGLFKDEQLVAWVLVRETGPLLHLFTVHEERRKGYGDLVLKLISNILLKDGKCVVAFCKKGNVTAAKLYEKLKFQELSDVDWCTLQNKS